MTNFIPVTVPETFTTNTGGFGVESAAFFDEHARAGRMKEARGGDATNGQLIPAAEYLQQQRARMMMMMELAEATAHVDVYIVGVEEHRHRGGGGRGAARRRRRCDDAAAAAAAASAAADAAPLRDGQPRRLSGDQHAERVRRDRQPDQRGDLRAAVWRAGDIALAKAYQDAAGFHLKRPTALDT